MIPISIDDYFEKSGDTKIVDGTIEENENGFCIWRIQEDKLVLVQVYGNGKYWNEWATNKAKELKMKTIFFATKINPEIFKPHGFKVIGHILERKV